MPKLAKLLYKRCICSLVLIPPCRKKKNKKAPQSLNYKVKLIRCQGMAKASGMSCQKVSKSAKVFYYYICPARWRVAEKWPIYFLSTWLGVIHIQAIYTRNQKWAWDHTSSMQATWLTTGSCVCSDSVPLQTLTELGVSLKHAHLCNMHIRQIWTWKLV